MFSSVKVQFAGSIPPTQRGVLGDHIERHGGSVTATVAANSKPRMYAPIFSTANAAKSAGLPASGAPLRLEAGITHIVVDCKITRAELCTSLRCDSASLLPEIEVVHYLWIADSVRSNAMLDTNSYRSLENDSDREVRTGKQQQEEAGAAASGAPVTSGEGIPAMADEAAPSMPSKRAKCMVDDITSTDVSCTSGSSSVNVLTISALPAVGQGGALKNLLLPGAHNTWTFDNPRGLMYRLAAEYASNEPSGNVSLRSRMICFDMDGTLITTRSGKVFPQDDNDWKLFCNKERMRSILRAAYDNGAYLAIISNQSGLRKRLAKNPAAITCFQSKVDSVIAALGVPMDFICALDDDLWRKPRPAMWEALHTFRCPSVAWRSPVGPTLSTLFSVVGNSIYVGDAAGRPKDGPRPKDFSDSDLKLALNVGARFETPEVFFLASQARLHTELSAHGIVLSQQPTLSRPAGLLDNSSSSGREVVLLVAPPACGKSTLSRELVGRGYIRINQDNLKTLDKCLAMARDVLLREPCRGVVVDNTNVKLETRKKWVSLAEELTLPIRCIVLDVPKDVCEALSSFRMLDPLTAPEDRRKIDSIVINTFYKDAMSTRPQPSEGYYRVDIVPWSPQTPESEVSKRLFGLYLR